MTDTDRMESQLEDRLRDREISCVAQIHVQRFGHTAPHVFVTLLDVPRTLCSRAHAEAFFFVCVNEGIRSERLHITVVPV